ncbi:hypothetical protein Acsp04_34390 [Actinomadura sp. NBRC 104425]|nr:hypothetical protein Acsp04_34390 [Actinomadura sp. NBRC 104425]
MGFGPGKVDNARFRALCRYVNGVLNRPLTRHTGTAPPFGTGTDGPAASAGGAWACAWGRPRPAAPRRPPGRTPTTCHGLVKHPAKGAVPALTGRSDGATVKGKDV